VTVVVVVIVVMSGGGMVEAMVWLMILVNIILIIILGGVGCGGVGLWIRASHARFTLKMTHFWVALVKNDLKPYNLQGF